MEVAEDEQMICWDFVGLGDEYRLCIRISVRFVFSSEIEDLHGEKKACIPVPVDFGVRPVFI